MLTIPTHIEAAKRIALQKAPITISGLSHAEYMRRLAHVAAQWPDRRPVSTTPAWAPVLVSVMQAALATARTDVWGMP